MKRRAIIFMLMAALSISTCTGFIGQEPNAKEVKRNNIASSIPSKGTLSHDNWDKDGNYSITFNSWWGENGKTIKLYENGKLIKEDTLRYNQGGGAQSYKLDIKDKGNGIYTYYAELINDSGITKTDEIKVSVEVSPISPEKGGFYDSNEGIKVDYGIINETDKGYKLTLKIYNPNNDYAWNQTQVPIRGISFKTTSKVLSSKGALNYIIEGDTVKVNIKPFQRVFSAKDSIIVELEMEKQGAKALPEGFGVTFLRGTDMYPTTKDLPNFKKGQATIAKGDLIANEAEYYKKDVSATNDLIMLYNPPSSTQVVFGQPSSVYVNTVNDVQILMPSKYMAMALAYIQEVYGINPNYIGALGTKENFTCGFYPTSFGQLSIPVTIKGKTWYWGVVPTHGDGPFQQEVGNFETMKIQYPDLFLPKANHDDYTKMTSLPNDSKFIRAAISSATSLNMTRELLYAIDTYKFKDFVRSAADKRAETILVTYIYNRGLGMVDKNVFTTNRSDNMNSKDLLSKLGLNGFADHVPQVLGMLNKMNNDRTNVYDEMLTFEDVKSFMAELKVFFPNGVPTASAWSDMEKDVQRAFGVLSSHWGNNQISYRHDFITLIRVMKKHLPQSLLPSPKGAEYSYQIDGKER